MHTITMKTGLVDSRFPRCRTWISMSTLSGSLAARLSHPRLWERPHTRRSSRDWPSPIGIRILSTIRHEAFDGSMPCHDGSSSTPSIINVMTIVMLASPLAMYAIFLCHVRHADVSLEDWVLHQEASARLVSDCVLTM